MQFSGTFAAPSPSSKEEGRTRDTVSTELPPPPSSDHVPPYPTRVDSMRDENALQKSGPLGSAELFDWSAAKDSMPRALPDLPNYIVESQIGRGGMGVVYRAKHRELKRTVAIKMILSGAQAAPETLARFRAEAEAVAQIQHPHIVQIHEIGLHEGHPFLVLEYVDSGSLDVALRGQPMLPPSAAAWVEILARAVHVAHLKGIIHRDLKPANILLQRRPDAPAQKLPRSSKRSLSVSLMLDRIYVPKITDFGLAKRYDSDHQHTHTGEIVGTPNYMAPEQASGKREQLSPAVDIYALGAILYEMLTGRPPFHGLTPMDTLMQVMAEDPVPPSRLQPRLPKDLETICLKCLAKEPQRRYATALELAEDLKRFLKFLPIHARPIGRFERVLKWARRRPAIAGLSALSCTLLIAGSTISTYFGLKAQQRAEQYHRAMQLAEQHLAFALKEQRRADRQSEEARRQAEQAEASYQIAREALAHCLALQKEPLFQQGPLEGVRRHLQEAEADFYARFLELRGDDPLFQEERAISLFRLGQLKQCLNSQDRTSLQKAKDCYQQALAILAELAATIPDKIDLPMRAMEIQVQLVLLDELTGQSAAALASCLAGETLAERTLTQFPRAAEAVYYWSRFNQLKSILQRRAGQLDDAMHSLARAEQRLQQVLAEAPDQTRCQELLAGVYQTQAGILRSRSRFQEALDRHAQSQRIRERLVALHPEEVEYRRDLATTFNNLGNVYEQMRQRRDALRCYQQAYAIRSELAEKHPLVNAIQRQLASSSEKLANHFQQRGLVEEARSWHGKTLIVRERLAQSYPSVVQYRSDLAATLFDLGVLLCQRQEDHDGQKHLLRAISIMEELVCEMPGDIRYRRQLTSLYQRQAQCLAELGRPVEALNWIEMAKRFHAKSRSDHPELLKDEWIEISSTEAGVLMAMGQAQEALQLLQALPQIDNPARQQSLKLQAMRYLAQSGQLRAALAQFADWQRSLQYDALHPATHFYLARTHAQFAKAAWGEPAWSLEEQVLHGEWHWQAARHHLREALDLGQISPWQVDREPDFAGFVDTQGIRELLLLYSKD